MKLLKVRDNLKVGVCKLLTFREKVGECTWIVLMLLLKAHLIVLETR